jgi:hypothetical protein
MNSQLTQLSAENQSTVAMARTSNHNKGNDNKGGSTMLTVKSSVVRLVAFLLALVGIFMMQLPASVAYAAAPALAVAAPAATNNDEAYLECWVDMPYEIYIGEDFKIKVEVYNDSDHKAKNVKVFGKANPSGYFEVDSCSPNCNGTSANLGKIKSWNSKTAKYHVTAPHEPGWYTFEFYAQAHNAEQAYCGSYDIEVFGYDDQFFVLPGEDAAESEGEQQ